MCRAHHACLGAGYTYTPGNGVSPYVQEPDPGFFSSITGVIKMIKVWNFNP